MATASAPDRYGSSDTYSKLRPHSGERLMLMPGPEDDRDPQPAGLPAERLTHLGEQVASSTTIRCADAVGKQVAGSLPDRPTWSASFS